MKNQELSICTSLALVVPAVMGHSCATAPRASVESGSMLYRSVAEPVSAKPVSASASNDAGWTVGPVSCGNQSGLFFTPFYESSSMKLEDYASSFSPETFNMDRYGLKIGYGSENEFATFSLSAGDMSSFASRADTYFDIGMEVGRTFLPTDRLGLGIDLGAHLGYGDYESFAGTATMQYIQADVRIGLAYRPSSDALFAFSPIIGYGYRYFSGVLVFDQYVTDYDDQYDLSGGDGYLFTGGSVSWRPGYGSTAVAIEVLLMTGDIEGFMVSLPISSVK